MNQLSNQGSTLSRFIGIFFVKVMTLRKKYPMNLDRVVGTTFTASAIYRLLPDEPEMILVMEGNAINRGRRKRGPYPD